MSLCSILWNYKNDLELYVSKILEIIWNLYVNVSNIKCKLSLNTVIELKL